MQVFRARLRKRGLHHDALRELLLQMTEALQSILDAIRLQSAARHVERVGDHATNVAEMVIFMVKGEDVRHATAQSAVHNG
jgi:phosphate transport system protein